jgi:predicted pyridoxine 5'-phosphate oxidase superfamily flavin-nucleotide-binding protein
MNTKDYFENAKGFGVLATADADGKVNVAVYARPHFLDSDDENTATFIMNERPTYANIKTNPHAAYLFMEEGEGYVGRRLTITKTSEEDDQEKIKPLRRRNLPDECYDGKTQHLVHFRIDSVRPLIGTEE